MAARAATATPAVPRCASPSSRASSSHCRAAAFEELLRACLAIDPAERPAAADLAAALEPLVGELPCRAPLSCRRRRALERIAGLSAGQAKRAAVPVA